MLNIIPNLLWCSELEKKWIQEKRETGILNNNYILKDKHVLFVAGILNELASLISSYYSDNMEAAKEMGATVTYYGPASQTSVPLNAYLLNKKIRSLYEINKKKLIVVGHSKGGAELLYAILRYPDLITKNIVDSVILIQPSVGGSLLAENTCGWCFDLISTVSKPNLTTISPKITKQNFDKVFGLFNKAVLELTGNSNQNLAKDLEKQISDRIFYVRSQQSRDKLSIGIETALAFCNTSLDEHGPNDGLLLVKDQIDKRIGIDLGILKADHIDLTVSTVSNISSLDRKAFTRAMFKTIYPK